MDWFSIFKSISMYFSSHHSSCIFISDITIPFHKNIIFWLFSSFLLCLWKCQSGKHTHREGARLLAWEGHRGEGIKTSLFPIKSFSLKHLPLVPVSDGTVQADRPLLQHTADPLTVIPNRHNFCKTQEGCNWFVTMINDSLLGLGFSL